MPAIGNRGSQGVNPNKIKAQAKLPKPPAPKVYAPPKAKPAPSPVLGKNLQKTFGPLAKHGVGAKSGGKLAAPSVQREVGRQQRLEQLEREKPLEYYGVGRNKQGEQKIVHGQPQIGIVVPSGLPLLKTIAAASAGSAALGHKTTAEKVGSELASIGTFPFVAGFSAAKGGVEALKGKPQELEKLGKGLKEGVSHGALGELLIHGNPKGAAEAFKKAPVISTTEAAALEAGAGRIAGTAKRAVAKGVEKTTIRPPVALTQEAASGRPGSVHQRRYSKDLFREQIQKKTETRKPLVDSQGNPVMVDELGHQVPVLKPKNAREEVKLQKERARHEAGEKQSAEYRSQQEATRQINKIERPGRSHRPAVKGQQLRDLGHLIATGRIQTAKTFREDIVKEREKTEAALKKHEKLTKEGKDSNFRTDEERRRAESNVAMLRKVEADPKLDEKIPALVRMGESLGAAGHQADLRSAELNIRPAAEMERARYSEHAYAHQGARYFSEAKHTKLEAEALAHEAEMAKHAQNAGGVDEQLNHWAQQAHEHRLHVSGRDVEAMRRYEALQQAASDATARRKQLETTKAGVAAGKWEAPNPAQGAKPLHEINTRLKPESAVRVYRVTPDTEIHPGEGVTLERPTHAFAPHLNVISKEVPASSVFREPGAKVNQFGVHEYGYHPNGEANGGISNHALELARAQETAAHAEAKQAKKPPIEAGIKTQHGHPLTTEQMRTAIAATGRNPETISYVPHVVGSTGKGSFHMPFRPGMRPSPFPVKTRTGALQRRGATEISMEAAAREQIKKGVVQNLAEHLDRLVHDNGLRRPDGKYFKTPKEATEFTDRLSKEGKGDWQVMQAVKPGLPSEMRNALDEMQNPGAMDTLHLEMLRSRLPEASDRTVGNYVIMPRPLLAEHLALAKGSNEVEQLLQMGVGPFRRAVLSQVRWLVGNVVEPYLFRLPLVGAGINLPGLAVDIKAAKAITKRMAAKGDKDAAWALKQLDAHQLRSGLYVGKQRESSTYRVAEDFSGRLRSTLLAGRVVRNMPVTKQVVDMAIGLTDAFFHINKEIETSTQFQAFGKSVRQDIQNFTGRFYSTLKLTPKVVDELANYQKRSATRERYTKDMHDMLGQYADWSPLMKRLVRTYTPFIPWTLASLRFMYWTMPVHHTVAFGTLMKLGQSAIGDWEKEHAELKKAGIKGTLANSLVVPGKRGQPPGFVDWARYTPGGVTFPLNEGDVSGVTNLITPQLQGAQEALAGRGPFGTPLKVPKTKANPKGEPTGLEKAGIAANSLVESTVPFASQVKRLMQGGGTGYDNSNLIGEIERKIQGREPDIKPGSSFESPFNRVFNPFRETHIKPQKGTKTKPTKPRKPKGLGSGLSGSLSGGGGLSGGIK